MNPQAKPLICIQGLGFVGSAMAVAVARAMDPQEIPYFQVVGVDLPTPEGQTKIAAINSGKFPVENTDKKLFSAMSEAHATGNLKATADPQIYSQADIVLVDVHLDISYIEGRPTLKLEHFKSAIRELGDRMRPGSLIIIETTVPPGTCDKVISVELARCLKKRGLSEDAILLAHSYERVMPGSDYYDSIVNFWRVYAGYTPQAAEVCHNFLSKIVNVKNYPLTRLSSTTASETAKVLENSYRATTIAFMEEWGRFAETVGIDMFEIVNAIRMRSTHSNIRQPGFGVGGYCLTKDPLFTLLASREIFDFKHLEFPFCTQAVSINNEMPLASLNMLESLFEGLLAGKKIMLLGVSYRQDVGDTRFSPSQIFLEEGTKRGSQVSPHDPLVKYWPEMKLSLPHEIPSPKGFDAVVFAVPHKEYIALNLPKWLDGSRPVILDANNVLSKAQRETLRKQGCTVASIGRGKNL